MANFCTNCGRSLDGAGAFCKYCGAPLSAQPAAAPAQPQWQQPQPQAQQPQQWQQPQQPQAQPQWQQPQQPQPQWAPPAQGQWPQPQQPQPQQWTPPRAGENGWTAAPVSVSGAAAQSGGGWSAVRSAVFSPAAAVTDAVEEWADRRRGTTQPMTNSGVPAPGWSARISDPEVLAGLAKNRKAAKKFGAVLVPLPLIGFAIYGAVSDKMELPKALLYGAIVSVIFLIFALIGKGQTSEKNAYEATVTDKQTHRRRRSESGGSGNRSYSYYTELVTVVRTADGHSKKITERDDSNHMAWDYLQIGERFRYHPQLGFPYELWDKSHAPYLGCPVCGKKHAVTEDRCRKCGAPLLK